MSFITQRTDAPRVTLYVRGDMFGANDQQHAVVERLGELDAADAIDDYEVCVWNSRVRLTGEETPPVVAQYREFESWADDEGVDITPFFSVRERDSFVDGTVRELVLPVMCLVVRDDAGLVAVAPNVCGDETRSVPDYLDALEVPDTPARPVTVPAED